MVITVGGVGSLRMLTNSRWLVCTEAKFDELISVLRNRQKVLGWFAVFYPLKT